jgi:serine/threonine protein kinase
MKPHERVKDIFGQALQIESAPERESFLETACKDDLELRQQLETLLTAHVQAEDFLGESIKLPPLDTAIEPAGMMIGRYKLLEKIGEGGFGVVYMAEQQQPVQRKVALKIIKAGMDTRDVIARFEAERQALAIMDHPDISHKSSHPPGCIPVTPYGCPSCQRVPTAAGGYFREGNPAQISHRALKDRGTRI